MIVYEELFKKHGFSPSQQKIIELVGNGQKVLEVGCSSGYMTNFFLNNHCMVDVVEVNKRSIKKIPKRVNRIFNFSVEDRKLYQLLARDYDFIVLSDVIEHLLNPEQVLINLKKIATSNSKLIISTPNIACWPIRKELFFKGLFEYQESGILDKTHLHFFTINSLPKLLKSCGWNIEQIIGSSTRLPFEGAINKVPLINFIFKHFFRNLLVNKYKNLSYVHFITVAVI